MRYDKMREYLKENRIYIFIGIVDFIFLAAFFLSENIPVLYVGILGINNCICSVFFFIYQYLKRKKYHKKIQKILQELDKKFLLTDIIEFSQTIEDRFYYEILKECNKAMLDEIYTEKKDSLEYREYIEQWLHEIKNPLSTIQLICENYYSDITRKILIEITRVQHYMEQVLYYARSTDVEKDYMIKEVQLSKVVSKVLRKNKQLLIENKTKVQLDGCRHFVLTDEKWLEFIITQIINNSIQYKNEKSLELNIFSRELEHGVEFTIQDNGIGILESDIQRVFEKGYTGQNGRNKNRNSTGLGLYLCKKLCVKLGVCLSIKSQSRKGTSVILLFQRSK